MGKVADAWSKVAEEASKVWDGWGNLKPTLEALFDLANLYADRETEAAEIMSAQRENMAERDKRIAELEAELFSARQAAISEGLRAAEIQKHLDMSHGAPACPMCP